MTRDLSRIAGLQSDLRGPLAKVATWAEAKRLRRERWGANSSVNAHDLRKGRLGVEGAPECAPSRCCRRRAVALVPFRAAVPVWPEH